MAWSAGRYEPRLTADWGAQAGTGGGEEPSQGALGPAG